MPDRRAPARKLLIGSGLGAAAGLLAWGLSLLPFVQTVELKAYDLRLRATARPAAPHSGIALVLINDDSIRRLEPVVGRWPWPRFVHASLIDFLTRARAKLIVYDVLFPEADKRTLEMNGQEIPGEASDRAFADAVRRAGNVILGADVADEGLADASRNLQPALDGIPSLNRPFTTMGCMEPRPLLLPPIPELAAAAKAIGHTYTLLDADGPVRRTAPFVRVGDRAVPSLAVAAAMAARDVDPVSVSSTEHLLSVGPMQLPLFVDVIRNYSGPPTRSCRTLIAYRGPARSADDRPTFEKFSFYDLVYSEEQLVAGEKPEIDPSRLTDRIVIVGTSASGTYDVLLSPFAEGSMTGAEIHANVIDSLLAARSLAPASLVTGAALTLAAGLAIGLAGGLFNTWLTGLAAIVAAVAFAWLNTAIFAGGTWLPLVGPLLAVVLAFTGDLSWHYVVEGREKRQVKKLFSRYVAKDVFDRLLDDPSLAALGGVRRTMTVLFSDVRGFTAMSEQGTPEHVVCQLNEYFTRMVQVLFDHRGTLDKFVGDMVMALFGAPLDDPDHADHAVQAALAMSRALEELNVKWASEGRPTLDIGIGINTGDMVAGNIGSDTIMSYTVIGDAVNLGARLESLNKDYASRVIISEFTRAALRGRYDLRPLGTVVVKGKSKPVAIFEVRGSDPGHSAEAQGRVGAPNEVKA